MPEEFKKQLENFLLDILGQVSDPKLIEKYQDEYDKLIDFYVKKDFVTKDKVESIIDSSLSESAQQIKDLKEEKESLTKQNTELTEKNKILSIKNE